MKRQVSGRYRSIDSDLPEHASDWPLDGAAPPRPADGSLVRMRDPSS